jgi:hypothetical protein
MDRNLQSSVSVAPGNAGLAKIAGGKIARQPGCADNQERTKMTVSDDDVAGAGAAAMLIHQVLLSASVSQGILKRELVIELFNSALHTAEKMQSNAVATNDDVLISRVRATRARIGALDISFRNSFPPSDRPSS